MKIASFEAPVAFRGASVPDRPEYGLTGAAAAGIADAEPGTFGMKFLLANPALAALALLPPIVGISGSLLSLIDATLALSDAGKRFAKAMNWTSGGGDDPLDLDLDLDLDGDGIETFMLDRSGVRFDQDLNFFSEETGWLSGGDGFLVLDGNGNGRIEDVSEMFGGAGQTGMVAANDNIQLEQLRAA